MRTDAIVVGAGLSGLKAAEHLVAAGRSVVVLEARDRVGGRVMAGQLCCRVIDHGAQWVGPRHTRLLNQARRFEMETQLQYCEGRNILSLDGRRTEFVGEVPNLPALALVELAMLRRRWAREIKTIPSGAPWNAAAAKEWDSHTLETWIMKNLSTRASRAFARLVPAAYGANASEVSYLWMVEMLRSTEGLEQLMNAKNGVLDATFKGGANQIAQKMADALGERVILSTPVRLVSQDDNGVVVRTDEGDFEAAHVIVAMPPMLCALIDFDGLSPQRRALSQRMPQTAAIKFHVAYDRPFWRNRGYSGQVVSDELPLGLVMEDSDTMLAAFAYGRHALALSAMGSVERQKAVVDCLVDLFGPDASEPTGYAEKDWFVDEWSRGFAGSMGPSVLTQYGAALHASCGRIHWAGSETATQWPGYMEGALESGERAASEVLA